MIEIVIGAVVSFFLLVIVGSVVLACIVYVLWSFMDSLEYELGIKK